MKKRLLLLIAPMIALILECLPYGIIMYYAINDGRDRAAFTFSYFDLSFFLFGVNWLIGIFTCVIIILSLIYVFVAKQGLKTATMVFAAISTAFSVLLIQMIGFNSISVINVIVTVCLLAELILTLPLKKLSI